MRLIITVLIIQALLGCTTIHFDNGTVNSQTNAESTIKIEQWHHNVAFALYELSEPVNLDTLCGEQEWVTIKSEKSLINGIAEGVVNSASPIWYPKTATVTCANQ